jgi:hypothetical protein
MKRWASIVTAGALAALPALASADPNNPPHDQVVGHGILASASENHFAFSVHSDPQGGNPKGQVHFFDNTTKDGTPARRFQGGITCLRVSGNRATFVVDFSKLKNRSGDGTVITVEDNGNPPGQASLDRIGLSDFNGQPPPCPDPTLSPANGVVTQGDIDVRDATP